MFLRLTFGSSADVSQHLYQIFPVYFLENLLGHLHRLLAVGLHHLIHQVQPVSILQPAAWDAWEACQEVTVLQEPLEFFELFLFQMCQRIGKPLSVRCDCCNLNSK